LAKKREGTKVTAESFARWSIGFEKEMSELRKREEMERLKSLPGKEREEAKRFIAKLTGTLSLVERNATNKLMSSV